MPIKIVFLSLEISEHRTFIPIKENPFHEYEMEKFRVKTGFNNQIMLTEIEDTKVHKIDRHRFLELIRL